MSRAVQLCTKMKSVMKFADDHDSIISSAFMVAASGYLANYANNLEYDDKYEKCYTIPTGIAIGVVIGSTYRLSIPMALSAIGFSYITKK